METDTVGVGLSRRTVFACLRDEKPVPYGVATGWIGIVGAIHESPVTGAS